MLFPLTNLARRATRLLLIALILAACRPGDDPPNPYHLTADIEGNPSIERTWVEPEIEKVAFLSSGDEYTLYAPNALEIGADGRLYVFDYGNNRIKAFTRQGTYLRTYGEGEGRGPGQMLTMTDLGVWRDSLVYVVDGRQRRVLFFDRSEGSFLRHERYEQSVDRFALTSDSAAYSVRDSRGSNFLVMAAPERRTVVSQIVSRKMPPIVLDGRLHASRRRAVFVPFYFPVVLTYTPADTTGVAHPTPDYGEVPMPEARTEQGGTVTFPPAENVQAGSSLHEGTLAVQRVNVDSIEFDLYDADAMTYRHTVRLPIEQDLAVYGRGRAVVAQDTTVHIYRLERPTK